MQSLPNWTHSFFPAEGAFICHPVHGLVLAVGPFTDSPSADEHAVAFYVNDYALQDVAPWKVPAQVFSLSDDSPCVKCPQSPVPVVWQECCQAEYLNVFATVQESIRVGDLLKTVPAMGQWGRVTDAGFLQSLLSNVLNATSPLVPYAYWRTTPLGTWGFCGATPELLLRYHDGKLDTMALAGTARAEDVGVFRDDAKEQREHEIVADSICARLMPYGEVVCTPRQIRESGALVHFHSAISLLPSHPQLAEEWVRILHPTPALGPEPHTPQTMAQLMQFRHDLKCPPHFGAPFGVQLGGDFLCMAAIRGVFWQGESVSVASGGGVIASSSLMHEWRELALKRESTRAVLGLR